MVVTGERQKLAYIAAQAADARPPGQHGDAQ